MSSISHVIDLVLDGYAYLCNPPPTSWVQSASYFFLVFSIVLALPLVGLLLLDIASWLVMRTLGNINAAAPSTIVGTPNENELSPKAEYPQAQSTTPTMEPGAPLEVATKKRSKQFKLHITPLDEDSQTTSSEPSAVPRSALEAYWATPTETDFALSGAGIFSPPESRASSPLIFRRSRAASLSGDGASVSTDATSVESSQEIVPETSMRRRPAPTKSES